MQRALTAEWHTVSQRDKPVGNTDTHTHTFLSSERAGISQNEVTLPDHQSLGLRIAHSHFLLLVIIFLTLPSFLKQYIENDFNIYNYYSLEIQYCDVNLLIFTGFVLLQSFSQFGCIYSLMSVILEDWYHSYTVKYEARARRWVA